MTDPTKHPEQPVGDRREDLDWLVAWTLARSPAERLLADWTRRYLDDLRAPGGIFRRTGGA